MGRSSRTCLPSLLHESALQNGPCRLIAGVDEVGRGAWAGPVVAAAVILPLDDPGLGTLLCGVRDSKLTSHAERVRLYPAIRDTGLAIGVAWVNQRIIDDIGIAAANRRALERAVAALHPQPDAILLDYFHLPDCSLPQHAIPHGDAESLSIAAASIVAKLLRDRWMEYAGRRYPRYGFAHHKGYGTPMHRSALDRYGPCPLHRRSYAPIKSRLQ